MPHRRYKLQIYARGVTATTGSVSYTLLSSDFGAAPTAGGFRVDAAAARVESLPWQCRILDRGSTFTAKIADSSGRMHLLGRLTRLLSSIDSTASTDYGVMAVGRISDLNLAPNITSYDLTIADERWVERQTDVFTKANTAMLVPSGLITPFHNVPATPPPRWTVRKVVGNLVAIEFTPGTGINVPLPIVNRAVTIIQNDLKPGAISGNTAITSGNFTHCRWRNAGSSTDYEIATFDSQRSKVGIIGPASSFLNAFEDGIVVAPFYVWLVWATSQPTVGDVVTGYIYAPTHPPTEDLPLHIGGANGVTPFGLEQSLYQGTYSATTGGTVRFSTGTMASLAADASFGRLWVRITAPQKMNQMIDAINEAYSVAPFTDSSGKILPTPLRLPASTAISLSALATFGSSNIDASGHPTFEHPSGDVVNQINLSVPRYTVKTFGLLTAEKYAAQLLTATIDGITTSTGSVLRTHDTVTNLGVRSRDITLPGTPYRQPINTPTSAARFTAVDDIADHLAAAIFPRFGDGPIYSDVQAMRSVDLSTRGRLLPGTFVKLALGTFPNPGSLTRGSTRILQIIERWDAPIGPKFRLLDVGPNLAVLSAPSLALAQSTRDPNHAVIGTVSSIPSGARWAVQLAVTSTGSTAPATASTLWFPIKASSRGTASTTFTRGFLPSKRKIWGRVRAFKENRVGSAWSTNASVVTATIAAPNISGITNITAGTATLKITVGSTRYPTDVLMDTSTAATLGSSRRIASLPANTTQYEIVGTTASHKYLVGVRHIDHFGGVSAQDTTTYTSSSSFTQAPDLKGLTILAGA